MTTSGDSIHFPQIHPNKNGLSNTTRICRHQPGSLFFTTSTVRSTNLRMSSVLNPLQRDTESANRIRVKSSFGKHSPNGTNDNDCRITLLPLDRNYSPQPVLTSKESKREYSEYLRNEIERKKKEKSEEEARLKESVVGLARLMAQSRGGRPRRNEVTGELLDHKLPSSDVTSSFVRSPEVIKKRLQYHEELDVQNKERKQQEQQRLMNERQQINRHFEACENIWGRPGNGAPRNSSSHKKKNLSRMLL